MGEQFITTAVSPRTPEAVPEGYRFIRPGERIDGDCLVWDTEKMTWTEGAYILRNIEGVRFDPSLLPSWFIVVRDNPIVAGMGPDTPMTVNERGGKQSKLNYRFDLIDPLTLFALAEVCAYGAEKYGPWNWRRIDIESNLNHALSHIYAYMAGDTSDHHLEHAFCRLHFALSLHLTPGESERMKPDDEKV